MSHFDDDEFDDYDSADYPEDDYGADDYDDDSSETILCPNCREAIHEESDQCPYCGEYITRAARTAQVQPPWVIVTVILVLISIALWFLGPLL